MLYKAKYILPENIFDRTYLVRRFIVFSTERIPVVFLHFTWVLIFIKVKFLGKQDRII